MSSRFPACTFSATVAISTCRSFLPASANGRKKKTENAPAHKSANTPNSYTSCLSSLLCLPAIANGRKKKTENSPARPYTYRQRGNSYCDQARNRNKRGEKRMKCMRRRTAQTHTVACAVGFIDSFFVPCAFRNFENRLGAHLNILFFLCN